MAATTSVKTWINRCLEPLNVRIETWTAERAELARLLKLESEGQFAQRVFPVLEQFESCDPRPLLEAAERLKHSTRRFLTPADGRYSYANDYFTSPDAEVAYALVRQLKPKRLVEVGSGNSTTLFREAINDAGLGTELVSIDPSPRTDIAAVADRIVQQPLEQVPAAYFREALGRDDVLFIDSSHHVCVGNDVVRLVLNILPALETGVVVHFHDVFLPYEYPRAWMIDFRWTWNEQYLVQALLQGSRQFEVLWPGHFLQRTFAGFADLFDVKPQGTATSLWLRKVV
jgi:predicted O-methyltransferase YrrM